MSIATVVWQSRTKVAEEETQLSDALSKEELCSSSATDIYSFPSIKTHNFVVKRKVAPCLFLSAE